MADRIRAIECGGIGAFHVLAINSGLVDAINERLNLLKRHLPYHESDHVLNIAYNTLSGGTCLEDIELRRNDETYLDALGAEITNLLSSFEQRVGYKPSLYTESGRYMTGPHGVLVTRAINHKDIYRKYIGVDACMSALMRPGMYGAYHHITVPEKNKSRVTAIVDVVGSLCENNDKFAIQRELPEIEEGDILCIHDTGAHGHAMGFNYNGRLRPQELMLKADGSVELIRRAETVDDHFATLVFEPNKLSLPKK